MSTPKRCGSYWKTIITNKECIVRYKTGAEYLRDNLDVAAAGADPLFHALTYVVFGRKEPRPLTTNDPYPSGPPVIPPVVPPVEPPPVTPPSAGSYTISRIVGPWLLTIRASDRFAGAIESLIWRGKEFIDCLDHGRELQSACFFDRGEGTVFKSNPTEAGSLADWMGPTSTSVLLEVSASGNVLQTKSKMAFYRPVNGVALSNYILTKKVTIGHPASDHVIQYDVSFRVPSAHGYEQFEALTGYMPPEFSNFWTFDPATGGLKAVKTSSQGLPVIFSSTEGYAMGVYSPDQPNIKGSGIGYAVFDAERLLNPVVKWNCVFRYQDTPAGDYNFRLYVVVGSLENVRISMIQLHAYLKNRPPITPPVVPPVEPSTGPWMPPQTSGLHKILSVASKKEFFSVHRVEEGLLLGEYGLYEGGPKIYFFDGQLHEELHIPDVESVMRIIDPGDGLPLACTEHYGRIYKRTASGQWVKKYEQGQQPTLMLDMAVTGGAVYGVYNIHGTGNSGLVKSVDKGNTWSETKFTGKALFGLASDGTWINMVGAHNLPGPQNVHPIMTNTDGNVLCSAPDKPGLAWWGACGMPGIWNMGTWSRYSDGVDQSSYIYAFNDSRMTQVCQSSRPHIHAMDIYNGVRYAVASWDWEVSGKTAQLLSSADGYSWRAIADIPCSYIMGMGFGDGGVYLAGGKYREYGSVYFYKF